MPILLMATESLITIDNSISTLGELGEALSNLSENPIVKIGDNFIRISTPHTTDDAEIRSLRESSRIPCICQSPSSVSRIILKL